MKLVIKAFHKVFVMIEKQIRYIKFEKYRKKYGFNKWHMNPKIDKPYIKGIVNYIKNSNINENICIVECGCGLCNILADRALSKCRLVGVERNNQVFAADNEIYCKRNISFINGSFQDIKNLDIDWLIAVNFTHEISDIEMAENLYRLCSDNCIKYIILDEVTGNYKYHHSYVDLMPSNYKLKDTLGAYPADGGQRYIVIFENKAVIPQKL